MELPLTFWLLPSYKLSHSANPMLRCEPFFSFLWRTTPVGAWQWLYMERTCVTGSRSSRISLGSTSSIENRRTDDASPPSLLNRLHPVRSWRRRASTTEVTESVSCSRLCGPTRCDVLQWLSPPSLAMSTLQLVPAVLAMWW